MRTSATKSKAESRKGNKRGKPSRKSSVGAGSKSKPRVKGASVPHRGQKALKKKTAKKTAAKKAKAAKRG